MSDPLTISVSALLAYQRALSTASHNIANVNTDGYTRQRVEFSTQPPQFSGAGYLGNGVRVAGIERIYDGLLTDRVRELTASRAEADILGQLANQLSGILADPQVGLSPAMNQFFAAVDDLANDPSAPAARQALLDSAESLAARFGDFSRHFDSLGAGAETQLSASLESVNDLAREIAALNQEILDRSVGGTTPNDLLDRRDEAIRRLAEQVSVNVVAQGDGTLNLFVGSGQPLVIGGTAHGLTPLQDPFDPQRLRIGLTASGTSVDITGQLTGGRIGGLLSFRDQVLAPARNRLGQLTLGLAAAFNAQHRLGQDLEGDLGGAFFRVAAPQALPRAGNLGDAGLALAIADPAALVASDYRLTRSGADYSLTRISDGAVFDLDAAGFPAAAATIDGLSIAIAAGTMADGDGFLLQPFRAAAGSLEVAITRGNDIAAASPIRTAAASDNLGSAAISSGAVVGPPPLDVNLRAPVTIVFNDPPTSFNVVGTGTGDPVNLPYTSGAAISFNGWTLAISGVPAAGDRFSVAANDGGIGDNRNALALRGLASAPLLDQGRATLDETFASLVASTGARTARAQATSAAQGALLDQASAARDNLSGVNLDEEAANLLRFQQSYQAAARVIEVAGSLFDSLLAAVRR